jgi:3-oxoacyl-[acyl-carrier protein] reductase
MNEPKTRVAIVTGASRGIGLAVAEHLHDRGHQVLTCSRNPVDDRGDRWTHLALDLGSSAGLAQLLDHPLAAKATVLVNNVGQIRAVGGLAAEGEDEVRATFETNVFGPLECCRRVAPQMTAAGGGSIINISSIYGSINTAPPVLSYAATKAALSAITQSLAVELAPGGVRVNAVLPGNVDTDMTRGAGDDYVAEVVARTPIGRLGNTDDIAGAVEFLMQASFVTGHLLVVDGGISLVGG